MATEVVHVTKANRNQLLLESLIADASPFTDWIAIVAFYKAVHIVEAVFAVNEPPASQHSTSHHDRNHLLKSSYPSIWRHYYYLFRASLVARYLEYAAASGHQTYASFSSFLSDHAVLNDLLGVRLVGVETEAGSLLSGSIILDVYSPVPVVRAGSHTHASSAFASPPVSSPGPPPSSP